MTVDNQDIVEAIVQLANAVTDIAARCWADLGTHESTRIQQEMNQILEKMHGG